MPSQIVSLELPEAVMIKVENRAKNCNRTVQEELLDLVAAGVGHDYGLPVGIQDIVDTLPLLTSDELRRIFAKPFPDEAAERLEELNRKRLTFGLTTLETVEFKALIEQHDMALLKSANCVRILHERGEPLPEPTTV